jgi:hypothetical protein
LALERYEATKDSGDRDTRDLEAVESVVEHMPDEDLVRAREIYRGLAASDFHMDRHLVASFMPNLTRHDPELGSRLWVSLMDDDDLEVRVTACDALAEAVGQTSIGPEIAAGVLFDVLRTFVTEPPRRRWR